MGSFLHVYHVCFFDDFVHGGGGGGGAQHVHNTEEEIKEEDLDDDATHFYRTESERMSSRMQKIREAAGVELGERGTKRPTQHDSLYLWFFLYLHIQKFVSAASSLLDLLYTDS